MKEQKKKQRGITLIALVISIIVMLILAGVSLNMTIGDNGIISQAQEATIQSGMAALQEYIQQEYVKNFERFTEEDTKVAQMQNMFPQYFYIPSLEGIGNLRYIVDSSGHALYLIKKSGLPKEIKDGLVGGNAGNGTYVDYATLNDVYGVTADLKVYYSKGNGSDLLGLTTDDLDNDNPLRTVFSSANNNEIYNLISTYDKDGDGEISAEEVKSITTLTLNSNNNMSDLSYLVNFNNLQELTLNKISLTSLNGIENCVNLNYLRFANYGGSNVTIGDYSKIKTLSKLKYIYLTGTDNTQVDNVFSSMENVDYNKLTYVGVYSSPENVTDISSINKLSVNTKKNIIYLYLYNNKISSISSLTDFVAVQELHIYNNSNITTLSGVEKMPALTRIDAHSCNLGANEVYDTTLTNNGMNSTTDSLSFITNLTNLSTLEVNGNSAIKWISYVNICANLSNFNFSSLTNMVSSDVALIKDFYYSLSSYNKETLPNKYRALFNSSSLVDYKGYETNLSNNDDEIVALLNNTNVKYLRLDGNTNLGDDIEGADYDLSEILETCSNVESLCLRGLTKLKSIDFVSGMPKLKMLDIWGCTGITDLSLLDTLTSQKKLSLKTLRMNNSSINLNTIAKTISGLNDSNVSAYMFSSNNECRGFCASKAVYTNLKFCTDLTSLEMWYRYGDEGDMSVDLSNCSKLTHVSASHCKINFILPSNVTYLYLGHWSSRKASDLSRCTKLKTITLQEVYDRYDTNEWLTAIGKCSSIETISMSSYDYATAIDFSKLSGCINLKSITMSIFSSGTVGGNRTISGLDSLTKLETFSFTKINLSSSNFRLPTSIKNVTLSKTGIDSLDFLNGTFTNLKTVTVNDNKISSLRYLNNATNLEEVNLNNNLISDTSSYKNAQNEKVTFNNIELLANLNTAKGGKLTKLYLSGNTGIVDFSPVSSLAWTDKSGF